MIASIGDIVFFKEPIYNQHLQLSYSAAMVVQFADAVENDKCKEKVRVFPLLMYVT